jgi:hypothetical protein
MTVIADREWSIEEVEAIFSECSNWGRWGADDELGTLNFITSEKVIEAASQVQKGLLVSIGKDLSTQKSGQNPKPVVHTVHAAHSAGGNANTVACDIAVHNHGPQTHMDPTGHCVHKGMVYPGKSAEVTVGPDGLHFGSIHARRGGIMTRGVLLDVPGVRGVDYLEPADAISADDLAKAEAFAGMAVSSGDAIMVRSGLAQYLAASGQDAASPRTGLAPDAIRWVHDKEVSVVCNECPERLPISPEVGAYWHIGGLVYLGLTFVESVDLSEVARICRNEQRYSFMFVVSPLRIPNGTGTLVNPLVAF